MFLMSCLRELRLMTNRIVIFYGSKKDFEKLIARETHEDQITIPFMELIQHYNARLRPNESGVRESALNRNIDVDNCIVRADDYGSVLEHVLSNFVNIVTLNHDIGTLFVHNPPRKVRDSLHSAYGDDIEYFSTEYLALSREQLKEVYVNNNIIQLKYDVIFIYIKITLLILNILLSFIK